MAESAKYPLVNKAKDLLIYTFKVTKPVGDNVIGANEAIKAFLEISKLNTQEERNTTVDNLKVAIDKKRRTGFPKSAVHTYISSMRQLALDIFQNYYYANNFIGANALKSRIEKINQMISECDLLLALIEISYELHYIDMKRMEHWASLTNDVKYITLSWKKREHGKYLASKPNK